MPVAILVAWAICSCRERRPFNFTFFIQNELDVPRTFSTAISTLSTNPQPQLHKQTTSSTVTACSFFTQFFVWRLVYHPRRGLGGSISGSLRNDDTSQTSVVVSPLSMWRSQSTSVLHRADSTSREAQPLRTDGAQAWDSKAKALA